MNAQSIAKRKVSADIINEYFRTTAGVTTVIKLSVIVSAFSVALFFHLRATARVTVPNEKTATEAISPYSSQEKPLYQNVSTNTVTSADTGVNMPTPIFVGIGVVFAIILGSSEYLATINKVHPGALWFLFSIDILISLGSWIAIFKGSPPPDVWTIWSTVIWLADICAMLALAVAAPAIALIFSTKLESLRKKEEEEGSVRQIQEEIAKGVETILSQAQRGVLASLGQEEIGIQKKLERVREKLGDETFKQIFLNP